MCVSICVCVCSTIFFPFIGDCGVCGKMSVAHFHTPIVFQLACRCGGYSPWLRFYHIIHRRCRGMKTDCCVGLCEGQNGSSCGLFSLFFHVSIQWGTAPALSWPSRRQESSLILLGGQHISQPTEAHRPSPPLRSPSAAEWRTKDSWAVLGAEDADMETHAHPSTNTHTNVPLNCSFYPPSALNLQKAPSDLFPFPWRGIRFSCACMLFCVFKHSSVCVKLWPILL